MIAEALGQQEGVERGDRRQFTQPQQVEIGQVGVVGDLEMIADLVGKTDLLDKHRMPAQCQILFCQRDQDFRHHRLVRHHIGARTV